MSVSRAGARLARVRNMAHAVADAGVCVEEVAKPARVHDTEMGTVEELDKNMAHCWGWVVWCLGWGW